MSAIDEGLDIDPALVPVYPVVRMEIRPVDGGLAEGCLLYTSDAADE